MRGYVKYLSLGVLNWELRSVQILLNPNPVFSSNTAESKPGIHIIYSRRRANITPNLGVRIRRHVSQTRYFCHGVLNPSIKNVIPVLDQPAKRRDKRIHVSTLCRKIDQIEIQIPQILCCGKRDAKWLTRAIERET